MGPVRWVEWCTREQKDTRSEPRPLRTSREQCARNRTPVRMHSPSPQTSRRHTDRYLSQSAIGTSWCAKSNFLHGQGWNVRGRISELLLVPGGVGRGPSRTVPGGTRLTHLAHAHGRRLSVGSQRAVLQSCFGHFLLAVLLPQRAPVVEQDSRRGHSHLGWVRAASPQRPTRDFGEAGRVADEVDPKRVSEGSCVLQAHWNSSDHFLVRSTSSSRSMAQFILGYLSHQVERSGHYLCATELISSEVAPRVDAQASGDRAGIGGWCPVLREDGQPDPKKSPWFSLEIRQDQLPWARREASFSDNLNPGSTCGPGGTEGFPRVRRRTAQEEGTGHAYLDR